MNEKSYKILAVVIVVLILGIILVGLFFPKQKTFAFVVESEKVFFYSDVAPPAELFEQFALKRTFIISPELDSERVNAPAVTDSLLVWLGVLEAYDKNAVSLIRVVDSSNNLVSCRSNLGDIKTDVELSVVECNALLSSDNLSVKVLILAPDISLSNPEVILGVDSITIKPIRAFDESTVSVLILEAMFDGTQQVLDGINDIARRISG